MLLKIYIVSCVLSIAFINLCIFNPLFKICKKYKGSLKETKDNTSSTNLPQTNKVDLFIKLIRILIICLIPIVNIFFTLILLYYYEELEKMEAEIIENIVKSNKTTK